MNRSTSIAILLVAAAFEAGGDALMRIGLHKNVMSQRVLFFALAAVVLFAYGWTVNAPPWDFGKVIGIYVVFFFLIAQAISWIGFKNTPSPAMWIGTILIVSGGIGIATAMA